MKKIISFLIIIITLFIYTNVKAITISDNSAVVLEPNGTKTIDVYAEFSEEVQSIDIKCISQSNSVSAGFIAADGFTSTSLSGVDYVVTPNETQEGNVKIGSFVIQSKGELKENTTVSINGIAIEVTVNGREPEPVVEPDPVPDPEPQPQLTIEPKEEPKVEPKEEKTEVILTTGIEDTTTNLLERIDSKIVKIILKDKVYEYNISIDSDIEELDLEPIKKDDNTIVEISTQVIKELEDNKITITVKKGDIEETYIINVRVRPEIIEDVKIQNTNYKAKYIAFILIFGIIIVACVFLMKREK